MAWVIYTCKYRLPDDSLAIMGGVWNKGGVRQKSTSKKEMDRWHRRFV